MSNINMSDLQETVETILNNHLQENETIIHLTDIRNYVYDAGFTRDHQFTQELINGFGQLSALNSTHLDLLDEQIIVAARNTRLVCSQFGIELEDINLEECYRNLYNNFRGRIVYNSDLLVGMVIEQLHNTGVLNIYSEESFDNVEISMELIARLVLRIIGHERRHSEQSSIFMRNNLTSFNEDKLNEYLAAARTFTDEENLTMYYNQLHESDADYYGQLFANEHIHLYM